MSIMSKDLIINAPAEFCFSVLCDYENYPSFLNNVHAVHILRREENFCVAQFELDIVIRVNYTVKLIEEPFNKISWSYEHSDLLTDIRGGWTLVPQGPDTTKATYNLGIKLKGAIPGSVSSKIVSIDMPNAMRQFKEGIENLLKQKDK